MSLNWLSRLILALTTIIVPATILNVAQPCRAQTPVHVSLAGQLLIASPTILDPHFDHAVILIVRHDQGGAMGIVINMPAEERPLANILEMLGEKDTNVAGKVHIFAGGPVQPEIGFVIHNSDYRVPGTIDVNERVLMTSSSQILRDIGNNKGPKKSLIAFGYAGWVPGRAARQLPDQSTTLRVEFSSTSGSVPSGRTAKPRPKTKPARRITLSDEEKAKYEALAKERDKTYGRHVPIDSPKR